MDFCAVFFLIGMVIKDSLNAIRNRIDSACARSRRPAGCVTLVVVTKTILPEVIDKCLSLGVSDIGENKIQEAERKFPSVKGIASAKKHMLGHLQTNKAKKAVELFDVIQSLDSERLARELDKQAAKLGKTQECFVELKISSEESKTGLVPEELTDFLNHIRIFGNIKVTGIMGMPPFFENPEDARPYFKKLKQHFDKAREYNANLKELSMGMSSDFEAAVEEGATMVRVGTAIFKDK